MERSESSDYTDKKRRFFTDEQDLDYTVGYVELAIDSYRAYHKWLHGKRRFASGRGECKADSFSYRC